MAFLGWFGHYVLVFVILAAVAGLGVFAGIKWSKSSAAKKAAQDGNTGDTK